MIIMVRVAHVHMSACTGCLISLADTYEKLPEILSLIDLVYCTTLSDVSTVKKEQEEKISISRDYPENVDIALVEGSVCIDDNHSLELIKDVRNKTKIIVSLGSCSSTGGVTRFCRGGQSPQPVHSSFVPVGKIINVDYAIPGCAPSTESLVLFLLAALNNDVEYLEPYSEFAKKYIDSNGYDLIKNVINNGLCMGCGTCVSSCPTRSIVMIDGKPNINMELCINCGVCVFQCPRIKLPTAIFKLE